MKLLLGLLLIVSAVACNKNNPGYREEQEEHTAPHDYSSGKDSKEPARTRR